MKKFFDTEKKVKEILEKYPATRKDDWFLLMTYWHLHAPCGISYVEYYHHPWKYNAPSYKNVERCRRKLQSKYPELKDESTADARFEETMKYEQYAING